MFFVFVLVKFLSCLLLGGGAVLRLFLLTINCRRLKSSMRAIHFCDVISVIMFYSHVVFLFTDCFIPVNKSKDKQRAELLESYNRPTLKYHLFLNLYFLCPCCV